MFAPLLVVLFMFPVFISSSSSCHSRFSWAQHNCVLTSNQNLRCWGHNNAGQLGLYPIVGEVGIGQNQMGDYLPPPNIDGAMISAHGSYRFSCAISTDLDISCWG